MATATCPVTVRPFRRTVIRATSLIVASALAIGLGSFVISNRSAAVAVLRGELVCVEEVAAPRDPVPSTGPVAIPVAIRNVTWRDVAIYDRTSSCARVRLDGLPSSLRSGEKGRFLMVVYPDGFNGNEAFAGLVEARADDRQQQVALPADLVIHADEVRRTAWLGPWRAGGARVRRAVTLENLPVENLVRVGSVSPKGWSVRNLSDSGRDLVIEIEGETPPLASMPAGESVTIQCQLLFNSPEVRLVRAYVRADMSPEWDVPELVSLDSVSCPDGHAKLVVVHRPRDERKDTSKVDVAEIGGVRCAATQIRDSGDVEPRGDWKERCFEIPIILEDRASARRFVKLKLSGDDCERFVEVPVLVTAR